VNAVIYIGSGQIHLQFIGKRIKCPFNGYKTSVQPKDMKQEEKPRGKSRRRYNKGKSAKKAAQKEEPAKQVEHSKKEWWEKENACMVRDQNRPRHPQNETQRRGPALWT